MITITGAAGKLGRLVAQDVIARVGATGVTLASRDPAKLADFAPRAHARCALDFDDSASRRRPSPAPGVLIVRATPNDAHSQHRAVIDAAKRGAWGGSPTPASQPAPASRFVRGDPRRQRGVPEGVGSAWTILRNNQYAENPPTAWRAAETGTPPCPAPPARSLYRARRHRRGDGGGAGRRGPRRQDTSDWPRGGGLFQIGAAPPACSAADQRGQRRNRVRQGPRVGRSAALPGRGPARPLRRGWGGRGGGVGRGAPAGRAIEPMTAFVARVARQSWAA